MRLSTMCLRNLFIRKARTSLCIIGIAFAVMSVITVYSVTSKYVEVIKEMNVFFSGELVVVAKGSLVINAFPIAGTISQSTVDRLRTVQGVAAATPMLFVLNQPTSHEGALQLLPSNVTIGVPAGNWSVLVGSSPLKGGSWPLSESAKQIVIGPSIADLNNLTVGSVVKIKNVDAQVVGILDSRSSLLSRAIIMPLKAAQDVYGYNLLVSMIVVGLKSGFQINQVSTRIEKEVSGISALTEADRGETVEPILNEVALWNLGIGGMLFLLSMILVTTVAMMNVAEKRRDFATLHAIGAPSFTVFRTVLTETALLGFFGGLLGVSLGVLATIFVVAFYTGIPLLVVCRDAFAFVSPVLMLETLGSAILVVEVAGVIPAVAAARTNIAQILKGEY